MIKAVKFLNLTTTILFVIITFLVYAYLPINVDLNIEGLSSVHKHRFFYYSVSVFLAVNILLRLIINLGFSSANENLKAWLMSLIFILNLYLTLTIGFVGVWNNSSHISPANYSYLNFIGPVLIIFWVLGLIFFVVKER